jgi:hypothetical protein
VQVIEAETGIDPSVPAGDRLFQSTLSRVAPAASSAILGDEKLPASVQGFLDSLEPEEEAAPTVPTGPGAVPGARKGGLAGGGRATRILKSTPAEGVNIREEAARRKKLQESPGQKGQVAIERVSPTAAEKVLNAFNAFSSTAVRGEGQNLKQIGRAAAALEKLEAKARGDTQPTTRPENLVTFEAGEALIQVAEDFFPENPQLQGDFLFQILPSAAGSLIPLLTGGILTKAGRGNVTLAIMAIAGSSQAESFGEEAAAFGADEKTQTRARLIGGLVGSLEAIPLQGIVGRVAGRGAVGVAAGGADAVQISLLRRFLQAGVEGLKEATQETISAGALNVAAKKLFDENRKFFDSMIEQGAAGGVLGTLLGIVSQMSGVRIRKARVQRTADPSRPGLPAPPEPVSTEFTRPSAVPITGIQGDTESTIGQQRRQEAIQRRAQSPPPDPPQESGIGQGVAQEAQVRLSGEQKPTRFSNQVDPQVTPQAVQAAQAAPSISDINSRLQQEALKGPLGQFDELLNIPGTEAHTLATAKILRLNEENNAFVAGVLEGVAVAPVTVEGSAVTPQDVAQGLAGLGLQPLAPLSTRSQSSVMEAIPTMMNNLDLAAQQVANALLPLQAGFLQVRATRNKAGEITLKAKQVGIEGKGRTSAEVRAVMGKATTIMNSFAQTADRLIEQGRTDFTKGATFTPLAIDQRGTPQVVPEKHSNAPDTPAAVLFNPIVGMEGVDADQSYHLPITQRDLTPPPPPEDTSQKAQFGRVQQSIEDTRATKEAGQEVSRLRNQFAPLQLFRAAFNKGVDFIRAFNVSSAKDLASGLDRGFLRASQFEGRAVNAYRQLRRQIRLNKADRVEAMKAMNGRVDPNKLSDDQRKLFEVLRDFILNPMTRSAADVGFTRRLRDGSRARADQVIATSGRAFPERLTRKATKDLRALDTDRGMSNVKARRIAERIAAANNISVDEALGLLKTFRRQQINGEEGYFTSTRMNWPEDMIEWDPDTVLPGLFANAGMQMGMGAEFGVKNNQFVRMDQLMQRMQDQGVEKQTLDNRIRPFINFELGLTRPPKADHSIFGVIRLYETLTKLSTPLFTVLNYLQPVVTTLARQPLSSVLQSVKDLPPVIGKYLKSRESLVDSLERTGSLERSRGGFVDLGDIKSTLGRIATFNIAESQLENALRSGHVARLSLDSNLAQLIDLRSAGPFKRLVAGFRMATIMPEATVRRALGKAQNTMDTDQLADLVESGVGIPPNVMDEVAIRAVHDEQFAQTLMSRPLWWKKSPLMQTTFQFSPFMVRMTGLIWNDVLKEAALGNGAPFIKFLIGTLVASEIIQMLRDILKGTERSVTFTLANQPEKRNAGDVARLAFTNLASGGALGVLADMTYGLVGVGTGPVFGTIGNMLEFSAQVVKRPNLDQAWLAAQDAFNGEVLLPRQLLGLEDQLTKLVDSETQTLTEYNKLRSRAFEFSKRKEAGDTIAGDVRRITLRALEGFEDFRGNENTLRFKFAARAVAVGETDKAAEYIASILVETDPAERADMAKSLTATGKRWAPLGPVKKEDLAEFQGSLTKAAVSRTAKVQAQFLAAWAEVVSKGKSQALAELRRTSLP